MKVKKFLLGAGMFAVCGVIGKVIGVFYRLPLTNILGAEGMGIYQMIFPIYSLILAVCCGGLPAAISKYVSELNSIGKASEARSALKRIIAIPVILGIITSAALFVFRDILASLQGNVKAGIAYAAIAPAVFFSCIIACFRGYFQGLQNMLPSGISQLIEQVVKVLLGVLLASVFMKWGIKYGVVGALIGVSAGEFAALSYLVIRYNIRIRKVPKPSFALEAAADIGMEQIRYKDIIKRVYSVALPIAVGSLIMPLSQAVDSFLVINLLIKGGADTQSATAFFGLFNGPVGSLINMPTVISAAIAAALLPKIAFLSGKGKEANTEAEKCMNIMAAVMLPCAVVFFICPTVILRLLYSRGLTDAELKTAATLLRIESVNVLFLGLVQLSSSMLQGSGKARLPLVGLIIGVVIKFIISVVLLPVIGIYGAALANVVCYGVVCLTDMIWTKRHFGSFINLKIQAKILLCLGCFAVIMSLTQLFSLFMNDIMAFICVFLIASGVYLILLFKTKCILLREMLL